MPGGDCIRSCGLDGFGQLPRMAGRERARAQGGGCCRDPGDGASWSRAPDSDWMRQDSGACGQPLVPTAPQSRVQIFSNYTVLAGAPLRNRTVDLLLTMQADTVWLHRIGSDCCSSERYRCLSKSYCVCGYLEPLSLGQSLARVNSVRRYRARSNRSRFMTLSHAATKSPTNLSWASALA